MNSDNIESFCFGALLGTAISLIAGYFTGTAILKNTLREHEIEKNRRTQDTQEHLYRAHEALNDENQLD